MPAARSMPLPLSPPATVLAWVGIGLSPAASALLALDAQLAEIVRTTTTPLVGQMRLAWWDEALRALDTAPAPAQPVLRALQAEVLPRAVSGAALAAMIDGWEGLLTAEELGEESLALYADARGAGLFAAMAQLADIGSTSAAAGRCWALADLAAHVTDPALAGRVAAAALGEDPRSAPRFALALASDARLAAAGKSAPGSPRRAAGVLRAAFLGL